MQSERHLTGIKSVFGGLRNYFGGKSAAATATTTTAASANKGAPPSTSYETASEASDVGLDQSDSQRLDAMRRENHPGLRGAASASSGRNVDDVLDSQLEEMSLGLGRLKGLATNLNKELDEHNEIIDRLDHKTSSTQWRVEKQNKDIGKLLKK